MRNPRNLMAASQGRGVVTQTRTMTPIVLLAGCMLSASAFAADCNAYAANEKARAGKGRGDIQHARALHACLGAERDQKVYDSMSPDQRKRFARRILPRRLP